MLLIKHPIDSLGRLFASSFGPESADAAFVVVHSANAIGSGNMMGYINNYRHIHRLPQNCIRVQIEHTV